MNPRRNYDTESTFLSSQLMVDQSDLHIQRESGIILPQSLVIEDIQISKQKKCQVNCDIEILISTSYAFLSSPVPSCPVLRH